MTLEATGAVPDESSGDRLLAVVLAMALSQSSGKPYAGAWRMTRLPDPEPSGLRGMLLR